MLRLQQEGTENERIEQLQEQLEQKHRKMNELETEQRWLLPLDVMGLLHYIEVGYSAVVWINRQADVSHHCIQERRNLVEWYYHKIYEWYFHVIVLLAKLLIPEFHYISSQLQRNQVSNGLTATTVGVEIGHRLYNQVTKILTLKFI